MHIDKGEERRLERKSTVKKMDGFIRRGCWPFILDMGQVYTVVYSSFRRSRQVKTAWGVDICGHRKEQKAANWQSLQQEARVRSELEFLNSLWGLGTMQVGIGLSYRPARLHRLAEFIPQNRFLGSINVKKYGLWTICIQSNI